MDMLRNVSTGGYEEPFSTGNALHTQEQAAMGYDASTGRTPVEQTNNWAYIGASGAVKAAPGFIHTLTCITAGTVELHDHASAASASIFGAGLAMTAGQCVTLDILATTGIYAAWTSGKFVLSYR